MTTIKIYPLFNEIHMPNLIRYLKNLEFSIITTVSKSYDDSGSLSTEVSIVQDLTIEQKKNIEELFKGTGFIEFS